MPREGQELVAPDGNRVRFVRITDECLEMEAVYSGEGSMPPPHLHPSQDEHFEVLEGAVQAVIAGAPRRYGAGDAFDVPAGTPHQMGGDGPARIKWEVRPALTTASFFEDLNAGAAEADPPAFLARYADVFRLAQ